MWGPDGNECGCPYGACMCDDVTPEERAAARVEEERRRKANLVKRAARVARRAKARQLVVSTGATMDECVRALMNSRDDETRAVEWLRNHLR